MRTRIVWLLIGVALTVAVSQAWAKTLGSSKSRSEASDYVRESRKFEGRVSNRTSNVTCKRGLKEGDPQYGKPNSSGYKTADGTAVHRFDCVVRPSCCNLGGSGTVVYPSGASPYVRISLNGPMTDTTAKYMVVTMKHKRNALGQASYPVSARKANCSQERCVQPSY